jgi:hypothetical protein
MPPTYGQTLLLKRIVIRCVSPLAVAASGAGSSWLCSLLSLHILVHKRQQVPYTRMLLACDHTAHNSDGHARARDCRPVLLAQVTLCHLAPCCLQQADLLWTAE